MTTFISSIMIGLKNFPFFAIISTLPILFIQFTKYRKLNLVRIGMNYLMILYLLCMVALVFFPLPSITQAAALSTHDIQIIPFHFLADIVRETPFVITDLHTYLPSLFHGAVLQVVFNVLMTIPFGMFLRYYFGCNNKQVLCYTFFLSLFIEIAQLTGLFFIYHGSYRLCDIDDLMANTLGGYLGYRLACFAERFIPEISSFDLVHGTAKKNEHLQSSRSFQ